MKRFYLVIKTVEQLASIEDLLSQNESLCVLTEFESSYGRALAPIQRGRFSVPDNLSDPVLVCNLEQLSLLRGRGNLILNNSLPILNHRAFLSFLDLCGPDMSFVASFEQTVYELLDLRQALGEEAAMILPLYGRIPVMVSAGCIRETTTGCEKKSGFSHIKDRKNISFPVYHDCEACITTIYNSLPYSGHLLCREEEFKDGPFLIRFTTESGGEALRVLEHYLKDPAGVPEFSYTTGHLKRKVL